MHVKVPVGKRKLWGVPPPHASHLSTASYIVITCSPPLCNIYTVHLSSRLVLHSQWEVVSPQTPLFYRCCHTHCPPVSCRRVLTDNGHHWIKVSNVEALSGHVNKKFHYSCSLLLLHRLKFEKDALRGSRGIALTQRKPSLVQNRKTFTWKRYQNGLLLFFFKGRKPWGYWVESPFLLKRNLRLD